MSKASFYRVTRSGIVIFIMLSWIFSDIPQIILHMRSLFLIEKAQAANNDAMMVYDTSTAPGRLPKYRTWDGSAWSAAAQTRPVRGATTKYIVVKYAPDTNEAIMVTQGSGGEIDAQVWNGTTWSNPTEVGNVGSAQANYRGFDIEYEHTSGDAILVYGDQTADPNYIVWNGSSWSGATNIDVATTGIPRWIEISPNPTASSDQLAMIYYDANDDIFGTLWDGSAWDLDWDNSGAADAAWDTDGPNIAKFGVDVAYEHNSGDVLFIWADALATDQQYRTYSGGTLSGNTLLDIAASAGIGEWVQLASDPTSGADNIMYAVQDASSNLNTRRWDGSAWDTATQHAEHTATVEDVADRNFDMVWETHASNANDCWLIYGDSLTVSTKVWDEATDAWSGATTRDDDTAYIAAEAHPNSGAVFAAIYNDSTSTNDDINEIRLTGGSQTWTAISQIWSGATIANPVTQKVDIASRVDSSATTAIMVYSDEAAGIHTPKYRQWTGSWGGENSANNVFGVTQYMVLKFAPTRDEAILVTQGNTGDVDAQVWNGSTWGTVSHLGNVGSANYLYRGFDIDYEHTSGDAVIVYGDTTADPNYRVWDGTSWSDETNIDVPTTGVPNWIEMANKTNAGSDDMALILLDSNVDVYGLRWTGSAWSDMGDATVWDASASIATKKAIDVAYETTSGDIMFIWADTTSTDYYYRTYDGSLGGATLLDIAASGGVGHWVKLASDPTSGSNNLMFGSVDAGSDLNTRRWDGSAWDTATQHAEHSAAVEDINDRNFDIVWETHSSNPNDAWLVYGDGATVSAKVWDEATDAWSIATTRDDDTSLIQLEAQPSSGAVLAAIYNDTTSTNDDLNEINLTSGSQTWSTFTQLWAGPTIANPHGERVYIAAEVYDGATDPSWDTGAADYEIWLSSSSTWDAGTLVCAGTLTDTNASTVGCSSGTIANSTQYRVQVVLENVGSGKLYMKGSGDYIEQKNVKAAWGGTSPTLGACAFNDLGSDDGSTTCSVAFSGNDVRITNTGASNLVIGETTGTQGFSYLITTGNDVPSSDSTSYLNTSVDSVTEDSSKITITSATGALSLTASTTNSFDSALSFSFSSQTSTMSNVGAIQVSDTRGGAPGWSLTVAGTDWTSGTGIMQLDYDGTGTDGDLGKLCFKPANGTLYAESGSLTGVTTGAGNCFSASVVAINLITASGGNGTGTYWLVDMPAEQYFPSSPTPASYTTTITFTLSALFDRLTG